jgi:hypothetical protein
MPFPEGTFQAGIQGRATFLAHWAFVASPLFCGAKAVGVVNASHTEI